MFQCTTDIRFSQILNGAELMFKQCDGFLRNRRGLLNETVQIRTADFQEIQRVNAVIGFHGQFYRNETLKLTPCNGCHTMRFFQLRVP